MTNQWVRMQQEFARLFPEEKFDAERIVPPFEIYYSQMDIADANGHICTAESPEIAKQIVAALTAAFVQSDRSTK